MTTDGTDEEVKSEPEMWAFETGSGTVHGGVSAFFFYRVHPGFSVVKNSVLKDHGFRGSDRTGEDRIMAGQNDEDMILFCG